MPRLSVEVHDIPQEGIPRHFTSTGSALGIVDTELSITQTRRNRMPVLQSQSGGNRPGKAAFRCTPDLQSLCGGV